MPFPNPERSWHAERPEPPADLDDVLGGLGPVDGPVTRLSGGLANETFRLGHDRVLRVYRREPKALDIERGLLRRAWRHLRVPEVLAAGERYLVLRFVEHAPLGADATSGHAVGRALAEIHSVRFPVWGELGADLTLRASEEDFVAFAIDGLSRLAAGATRHAAVLSDAAAMTERGADRLRRHADAPALLHGDFKASNVHACEGGLPLVLDWEFAFAGPPLLDVGQLVRWGVPAPFRDGFVAGYRSGGGVFADDWEDDARLFDLFNVCVLLAKSGPGSRREADCLGLVTRLVGGRADGREPRPT